MHTPYYTEEGVSLFLGDALDVLPELEPESADMLVCSPPYYLLRDYGAPEQIGQESSFGQYIEALVDVFKLVRPILKPTATMWINLGDRFSNGSVSSATEIPAALARDGWIWAQTFIWHKTNATPFGAKKRATQDHEYVFLLAKQPDYFFHKKGVMIQAKWDRWGKQTIKKEYRGIKPVDMSTLEERRAQGKPVRTVWTIPTKPYKGQHDAVAPPELISRCVRLGCPEGGTILNPFFGAGTSALVARELGRSIVGVELVEDSLKQAIARLAKAAA